MRQMTIEDYIDSDYFDMDAFVIMSGKQYQVKELIDLINDNKIEYNDIKLITIL